MPITYSTEEFESKYTYTGSDLGANWSPEMTLFRLWAPTATSARVNLCVTGDPDADDLIRQEYLMNSIKCNKSSLGEVTVRRKIGY